ELGVLGAQAQELGAGVARCADDADGDHAEQPSALSCRILQFVASRLAGTPGVRNAGPQARSVAPCAKATSSMIAARASATSTSVNVRSSAWKRSRNARLLRPSPSWAERKT